MNEKRDRSPWLRPWKDVGHLFNAQAQERVRRWKEWCEWLKARAKR